MFTLSDHQSFMIHSFSCTKPKAYTNLLESSAALTVRSWYIKDWPWFWQPGLEYIQGCSCSNVQCKNCSWLATFQGQSRLPGPNFHFSDIEKQKPCCHIGPLVWKAASRCLCSNVKTGVRLKIEDSVFCGTTFFGILFSAYKCFEGSLFYYHISLKEKTQF